ncbi:MAG TPA: hypothetical protein VE777_07645 [Gaiellales bacterium]|jgi:hypothetical protein|nr:hypothetical protein [Gaiellales bacterium]
MLRRKHRTERANEAVQSAARRLAEDRKLRGRVVHAAALSRDVAARVRTQRSRALTDRGTARGIRRVAHELNRVARGLDAPRRRRRRARMAAGVAGVAVAGGATVWTMRRRGHGEAMS